MDRKSPMEVDGNQDPLRFANLRYEDFRRLAKDQALTIYEKIGFPDGFRKQFEHAIFADIRRKLPLLDDTARVIFDVGPGCTNLPRLLLSHCETQKHRLVLMDAEEMLDLLPHSAVAIKVPGKFPENGAALSPYLDDGADVILVYSVIQHVFLDGNPFTFLDALLSLLKPGGELLIGDIPNASMRNRFLGSEAGIAYHKAYLKTDEPPPANPDAIAGNQITDAVVLALVMRARAAGFHAYLLPQAVDLPMANRREDLYVKRP